MGRGVRGDHLTGMDVRVECQGFGRWPMNAVAVSITRMIGGVTDACMWGGRKGYL